MSKAFDSVPIEEDMVAAEDQIRQGTITADDIDRLAPNLEADIDLSLTSCFVDLHEGARADRTTLMALVDEGRVAVAGCATRRLQRTCEL